MRYYFGRNSQNKKPGTQKQMEVPASLGLIGAALNKTGGRSGGQTLASGPLIYKST